MFHSNLKAEIRKHWRMRARQEMEKRGQPLPADFQESQPGDGDLFPPESYIVMQRACCLAAIALRGLAATWSTEEQNSFVPDLQQWAAEAGVSSLCEKKEWDTLNTPAGELDQRAAINSCWRWEAAAVLLASLGKFELPSHDQVVDTQRCGKAAMLFAPPAQLQAAIASSAFDAKFDRFAFADQVLAIHWRIRQHQQTGPKPLDFAAYASGVKWATFNLQGVALADGDLSIAGVPITQAKPDDLARTTSINMERHQAANWLIGWAAKYSEVECPT